MAYSKLHEIDLMYASAETALAICKRIEKTLSLGETQYTSPLLNGLVFSRNTLKFNDTKNSLERYYHVLTSNKLLSLHSKEERYKQLIEQVKKEIVS